METRGLLSKIPAPEEGARSLSSGPQDAQSELSISLLDAVEKDAAAVARSLAEVSAGLRSSLSEITENTISHMRCHCDAAGLLQEASQEAASRGNRFVNECLRKQLRKVVDQLEFQANRYLPP